MLNAQQTSTAQQTAHNEIQRIVLESDIQIQFQSITSLESNEIVGHKALPLGPVGSELESTYNLIAAAQEYGLNEELEYSVLVTALGFQHELPEGHFLSISIGSGLFLSKLFREITNLCQHISQHIVFELTEQVPLVELAFMKKRIKEVQEMGYRVTLDNTNADLGYERVKKLRPSAVKVSLAKLEHITDNDVELAEFMRSIESLRRHQITIQAEGVKTRAQVSQLLDLGITLGQGDLSVPTNAR
jgi:EAL domain-containing protein (putative c-di-GMP-specific phosphodiesterase class I)